MVILPHLRARRNGFWCPIALVKALRVAWIGGFPSLRAYLVTKDAQLRPNLVFSLNNVDLTERHSSCQRFLRHDHHPGWQGKFLVEGTVPFCSMPPQPFSSNSSRRLEYRGPLQLSKSGSYWTICAVMTPLPSRPPAGSQPTRITLPPFLLASMNDFDTLSSTHRIGSRTPLPSNFLKTSRA
jgi:hypothetical protein